MFTQGERYIHCVLMLPPPSSGKTFPGRRCEVIPRALVFLKLQGLGARGNSFPISTHTFALGSLPCTFCPTDQPSPARCCVPRELQQPGLPGGSAAPAKPPGGDTEPGSELAPSAHQLQRFCGFHRFHYERGRTALGALTGWEKLLLVSSSAGARRALSRAREPLSSVPPLHRQSPLRQSRQTPAWEPPCTIWANKLGN